MTAVPLTAHAALINDKLKFTGTAGDQPAITLDYIPPLGDGEGYMPLQLLLISLAVCSASSVVTLIKRMGRTINGCDVSASGIRRETHPTGFSSISLAFAIDSPDMTSDDFNKAVKLSEDTYCPVWAMLRGNVDVQAELLSTVQTARQAEV